MGKGGRRRVRKGRSDAEPVVVRETVAINGCRGDDGGVRGGRRSCSSGSENSRESSAAG